VQQTVSAATAARCAECGRTFSTDNMIRYQNLFICQACKPVFMQKLAEGANIHTGEFHYAGFWIRVASAFVDGFLLLAVNLAFVMVAAGQTLGQVAGIEERTPIAWGVAQLAGLLVGLSYETFFLGRFGATLGKMACGLRVVNPDGSNISYLRALGRYFAKNFLEPFTLGIGYIIAAFDVEKRSLHDRICNTRVVYK
jgi:uncharacterized RDD family membrane protein YckC